MCITYQKVDHMCDHEQMEKLDELRLMVELWGCSNCDHEEVRVYYGYDGDYTVC